MSNGSTKTILLIEDNPGDVRLLREMLSEHTLFGTELTQVSTMSEAEKHLAGRKTDIILLDLGLPDVQGLAAVRRIHAAAPSIPMVVLTALDDESLALQALQEGAQDYLVKGQIETRGLARAMRYAVGRTIMAEALSVAEDKLRQAQKMQAVGQLTGGVAHDFNNLLVVILGNVEMARESAGLSERVSALLETAEHAAVRCGELTRRLLAFSRRQTLLPQRVDVNRLVDDIVKLLQRTLGETIAIRTRRDASPMVAMVDPGQLENALLNLGVNARDAMPNGGALSIAIGHVVLDGDHPQDYHEVAPGRYVTIAVSDDGSGMADDVKARAIEPFFTTKDVGKGSGLGLSMVYGFIKQSGGDLAIVSEVGHGTTIRLCLPVPTDDQAASPQLPLCGPDAIGEGQLVLVVEDDKDVCAIVVGMLEKLGFTVIHAPDGHVALAELAEERPFDLMITDIVMPKGMSGIQLVNKTRERSPELPVIFISGYSEDNTALAEALRTGGAFLSKPFTRAQLSDAIHAAMGARG